MKNSLKITAASLLAITFMSTSVFASVHNNFEDSINEGNVIASGGFINYDDMEAEVFNMDWTYRNIASGNIRGEWRHRMIAGTVQSHASSSNGEARGIAASRNDRREGPWRRDNIWSQASVSSTLTGNTSGWDLRPIQ